MRFSKFVLGIAITILSTIAFLNALPIGVNAEDNGIINLQNGVNCVENTADCGDGSNLMQALKSGQLSTVGTQILNLEGMISAYYGADKRRLCISDNVNDFITVYGYRGVSQDVSTVRVCPSDATQQFSESYRLSGDLDVQVEGCCPSGYQFVTERNQSFLAQAQDTGACCKIPIDKIGGKIGDPGYPAYVNKGNGCYDANGNRVQEWSNVSSQYSQDNQPDIIFKDFPVNDIGAGDYQYQGISLNPSTLSDLGGSSIYLADAPTGSAQLCPADYPCVDMGNGSIVSSRSLTERSDLACQKCYRNNEPIRIENGQTLYCDGAKAAVAGADESKPVTSSTETIGGSANLTEACLQNGDVNSDNYKACGQCLERGGIWIAIGCVDTSPLGIITGLIRISYGVMGGVALIQLIIVGIYYQTGQADKIAEARKQIIATLTGIAVLTFSVLILRIIGVNILDILPAGSI